MDNDSKVPGSSTCSSGQFYLIICCIQRQKLYLDTSLQCTTVEKAFTEQGKKARREKVTNII